MAVAVAGQSGRETVWFPADEERANEANESFSGHEPTVKTSVEVYAEVVKLSVVGCDVDE